MPIQQKILAIVISLLFLSIIVEMVRRRRLQEQYCIIWLVLGISMLVFGLWHDALVLLTKLIGAGLTSSTLFFFGIAICLLLNLQASFHLSRNATHIKNLSQEVALLRLQLHEKEEMLADGQPSSQPRSDSRS